MTENQAWVVIKFGGTSVSSLESWETIARVVRYHNHKGRKVLLVCSAITQISNQIEKLIELAQRDEHQALIEPLIQRHYQLMMELGLEDDCLLSQELQLLKRLTTGISLIGHSSPQISASLLALGELMLSRIGHLWLQQQQQINCQWLDVRSVMVSVRHRQASNACNFLAAKIESSFDSKVQEQLNRLHCDVVITQGFIAADNHGQTVILGRGGSDTSAGILAAKINAQKVEIWSDVPGMFTANPASVPSARLLKLLDYDEAQELATSGAKVLHPRCIEPLRKAQIPLELRWTRHWQFRGTQIQANAESGPGQVKAVISRSGIRMISLEGLGMWQEVGFLARAFQVFEKYGISIDMVATSQSNVTVTIDQTSHVVERNTLDECIDALKDICRVTEIGPCSGVSLVGKNIRSILYTLGPVLTHFADKHIYMVSQAASDLNITFVVDENEAEKLVRQLHSQFSTAESQTMGPMWKELFENATQPRTESSPPWWQKRREQLLSLAQQGPGYVYCLEELEQNINQLKKLKPVDSIRYAVKANSHPDILRLFAGHGLCFDCVSIGEIEHVLAQLPDLDPQRILFTPNFAPQTEYRQAFDKGVIVTLDNSFPLFHFPEDFRGRSLFLRLDPGFGQGHHKHVRTAGHSSKFGIAIDEIPQIQAQLNAIQARVVGLHAHVGSGVLSSEFWSDTAQFLQTCAAQFPEVKVLDLGGGLGIPEKPMDEHCDLDLTAELLQKFKKAYPQFELWIEPGRFLVASAGVLLARVTQTKAKGSKNFIGLETGMNSLIRPPLYGAFHPILNLTREVVPATELIKADIVGPICETGDVFGHDRMVPVSQVDDVFCILNAGAYGRSMSSHYNLRNPAREWVIG